MLAVGAAEQGEAPRPIEIGELAPEPPRAPGRPPSMPICSSRIRWTIAGPCPAPPGAATAGGGGDAPLADADQAGGEHDSGHDGEEGQQRAAQRQQPRIAGAGAGRGRRQQAVGVEVDARKTSSPSSSARPSPPIAAIERRRQRARQQDAQRDQADLRAKQRIEIVPEAD